MIGLREKKEMEVIFYNVKLNSPQNHKLYIYAAAYILWKLLRVQLDHVFFMEAVARAVRLTHFHQARADRSNRRIPCSRQCCCDSDNPPRLSTDPTTDAPHHDTIRGENGKRMILARTRH